MSSINSTPRASTALEDATATKVANPLITSPIVSELRRNSSRRSSESALSPSSSHERYSDLRRNVGRRSSEFTPSPSPSRSPSPSHPPPPSRGRGGVIARTRSLPSIDAASAVTPMTRDGVVSAPGRGERRCFATEHGGGVDETASNLTVPCGLTVPYERRRGGRGRGAAVKELERSVPGEDGLVPADDRAPKVSN